MMQKGLRQSRSNSFVTLCVIKNYYKPSVVLTCRCVTFDANLKKIL